MADRSMICGFTFIAVPCLAFGGRGPAGSVAGSAGGRFLAATSSCDVRNIGSTSGRDL